MLPRVLPPAGTPIAVSSLLSALLRARRGDAEAGAFESDVAVALGAKAAHLVSSGRAALVLGLKLLAARAPERRKVILPAYTCYSVAASVMRAGLEVLPVDVLPSTLGLDQMALESVDTDEVLAVVTGNLFGLPDDLASIESFARGRGIFMVDDAAQAMGAEVNGRAAGTFGDLGLLSLDKGKNITTIQGGFLLVNEPSFVEEARAAVEGLPAPLRGTGIGDAARLLAYATLLNPVLYGIPAALLPLGRTPFDTEFPVGRYPSGLAAVGRILFRDLDRLNGLRQERGGWFEEALHGRPGVQLPSTGKESGVFLRFPVLMDSSARRDETIQELRRRGLGASGFYPRAIPDIEELRLPRRVREQPFPGARRVADGLLTLPTHSYVRRDDVERISHAFAPFPT